MNGGARMPFLTVGLAVTDAERTVRFYRDVFGLERLDSDPAGSTGRLGEPQWSQGLHARLSDQHSVVLECFEVAKNPLAVPPVKTISSPGLCCLTFHSDDPETVAIAAQKTGGYVVPQTRVCVRPSVEGFFLADPDGIAIEVLGGPGSPRRFAHPVLCVQDLEAAVDWYRAVGYSVAREVNIPAPIPEISRMTRISELTMKGVVLRSRYNAEIELVKILTPQSSANTVSSSATVPGLAYLAHPVEQNTSPAGRANRDDWIGANCENVRTILFSS